MYYCHIDHNMNFTNQYIAWSWSHQHFHPVPYETLVSCWQHDGNVMSSCINDIILAFKSYHVSHPNQKKYSPLPNPFLGNLCKAGPCGKLLPSKLGDHLMLGFSACPLSNVQVESEQSSLHTKHNLKNTHPPSLPHPHEKRDALHSMTRFLISCMEILFLKFAATIFGLG